MTQDNLTQKQLDNNGLSKWAVFLPAISGFYATFIGKQRVNNDYVDPARLPAGLTDMEQLNWLNSTKSLFPYKWSLYSGGHANLDLSKDDPSEDMVRKREPGSFILGDSGGFQIAKGLWEGDWKANSGCPKAQKKREQVLAWLDNIADYAMILDIPTWVIHDKKASDACQIKEYQEAVDATKFNNEYFMKNRKGVKNGGAKFLNVLQGSSHTEADQWYNLMKDYCDPTKYPDTHFDGWAMGGQNMCDVELVLKRIIALKYDNLLQQGKHDWMHFLGTSRLEWAVLLTVIQKAVRKYINPNFTISFDCASPFLATANGQVYHHIDLPHDKKWCYRMTPSIDDKKYATDTRSFREVALTDYFDHFGHFDESPVSALCKIKDICIYKPGDLNKIGKEGKTSWDSFSYALQMGHNVWSHIESVQRANREFEAGFHPAMMRQGYGDFEYFEDIVEKIFAAPDRATSEKIIKQYTKYWSTILGTRGFSGKKATNALTHANDKNKFEIETNLTKDKVEKTKLKVILNESLFESDDQDQPEENFDENKLDELEKGIEQ